jgi:hypothetical protein
MRTSRGVRVSVVGVVEFGLSMRKVRRELSISVVWRRVSSLKMKIADRYEGAPEGLLLAATVVSSRMSGWM